MSIEEDIVRSARRVKQKADEARRRVGEEMWKKLDPARGDFFKIVEVDIDGRKARVYKGLLVAGLRAVKMSERDIVGTAGEGARFASKINGGET